MAVDWVAGWLEEGRESGSQVRRFSSFVTAMALCFDVILRDIWRIWAWRRCTLAAEARDGWQASVVSGVVKAAAGASDDDVMLRAVRLSPGGLRR